MYRTALVALILGAVLLTGCSSEAASRPDALKVTVTTTQAADLLRTVGGEHVEVTALMGPGIDPHLYRATQSDVRAILGADVVVHHGLFLEGRMAEILEGPAIERTLALTDALPTERLIAPSGEAAEQGDREHADPHVWFDPDLWLQVVDPVVEELAELAPQHRADFEAGAATYVADVHAADEYTEQRLAEIPERARVLITSHDAFGYYGRAYGLEVLGVQGLSTDDEAGIHDIRSLAEMLVSRRIPALFTESSISPASVEAVRAAAADRDWDVDVPAAELYSDALGAVGTPAETYAGMLRANADTIASALGAP